MDNRHFPTVYESNKDDSHCFRRWYYIGRLYRNKRVFHGRELIVITGATSGIGLALANELASRNCHLVLGCRNLTNGILVRKELEQQVGPANTVDIFELDLSSLKSVVGFVDSVNSLRKPIYALVNNAGIFYAEPGLTIDGIEQTFQVSTHTQEWVVWQYCLNILQIL